MLVKTNPFIQFPEIRNVWLVARLKLAVEGGEGFTEKLEGS